METTTVMITTTDGQDNILTIDSEEARQLYIQLKEYVIHGQPIQLNTTVSTANA